MLVVLKYIRRMVGTWLELRRDPIKNAHNHVILENFFRKADFNEENAFFELLHDKYTK